VRAFAVLLLASLAITAEPTVREAWARATLPGQEAGALYLRLVGGSADDRLVSAESPAAAVVELHEHVRLPDGTMRMQQIGGGIAIPAGAERLLRPGSDHIMLIALRAPLAKGARVAATLRFASGAAVAVEADILDPWAMAFDER
jgi:copper(I)-binding protein